VALSIPVVFLHAFPLDASMWAAQSAALADRTCLTPDFPGFGGRPLGTGTPSLDRFAEAVVADLDAAGIDRAVVVGLSMGGYVAFRLHARWPERIAALFLADTKAGADTDEAKEKRRSQAERVREEGVGWMPEALLPALLGETTREKRPTVVEEVREMVIRSDPEGVARALLAMRDRPDSTPDLDGIRVPVLALAGEEDTITPVEEARAIAEAVPDGQLVVLGGCGHLSNLEAPSAFDQALARFLDELAS
jgi:pimeloyl-ACP methyl ester carboxylesterase